MFIKRAAMERGGSSFWEKALPGLARRVVDEARRRQSAVSFAHAAYALLTLPPTDSADEALFRFSRDSPPPSPEEAERAVADAVGQTLRPRSPQASALGLQVAFESALLDAAAEAAQRTTQRSAFEREAADAIVLADACRLRSPEFCLWLHGVVVEFCVRSLPCVRDEASVEKAVLAAVKASSEDNLHSASAAAAAKASAARKEVQQAVDAALPVTRLRCLYTLDHARRRQHLSELSCIVLGSLLLTQRRRELGQVTLEPGDTSAVFSSENGFFTFSESTEPKAVNARWLPSPATLAREMANRQRDRLLREASSAQQALFKLANVLSLDASQRAAIGEEHELR